MWFDNKAHKPKNADQGQTPATTATPATQTPKTTPLVAEVASVAGGQGGNQKKRPPLMRMALLGHPRRLKPSGPRQPAGRLKYGKP